MRVENPRIQADEGVDPTALVGSLSDPNPNVRLAGLRALAAVSPERGPEDRVEPFLGAAEPALRIAAAEGIGEVQLHGELWRARCDAGCVAGAEVSVSAVEGLTLTVEPTGRQGR